MQLRFVAPELGALDALDAEVLVATVFSDVRPAKGVAGLCDWRTGGRLSRLMREGFITGTMGEVVMIPGRPTLCIEKLLVMGAGDRATFGRTRLVALVEQMASTLVGLRARTAVVEMPGRTDEIVSAVEAATLALALGESSGTTEAWTLVEHAEGRATIEQHLAEQRRLLRRML
jgi:hypothetical protein